MNIKILFLCLVFVSVFGGCNSPKAQTENSNLDTKNLPKTNSETAAVQNQSSKAESPDEKAVRTAEEFIKRNGYTDAVADKENLSHETVEFSDNLDELLKSRQNTLESKAYGFIRKGKAGQKGWMVVFRYNKSKLNMPEKDYDSRGRAVTMNENFENLLVEHKDIFLKAVEIKLAN